MKRHCSFTGCFLCVLNWCWYYDPHRHNIANILYKLTTDNKYDYTTQFFIIYHTVVISYHTVVISYHTVVISYHTVVS